MKVALITSGSVGVQLINELLAQNVEIAAVSTSCRMVVSLCLRRKIEHFSITERFYQHVKKIEFDLLLSAINPKITPEWVLNCSKHGAFNYHDSLLPRHRGVNATNWAIWDGDSEIGYTWHQMTTSLDGGDILFGRSLPLNIDDDVRRANMKVFLAFCKDLSAVISRMKEFVEGVFALSPQVEFKDSKTHRLGEVPSVFDRLLKPSWTKAEIFQKAHAGLGFLLLSTEGGIHECEPLQDSCAQILGKKHRVWKTETNESVLLRLKSPSTKGAHFSLLSKSNLLQS
ncbi:hypothetical protein GW915_10340 [bacterium]|nr:hypothetical protein [bacterium]